MSAYGAFASRGAPFFCADLFRGVTQMLGRNPSLPSKIEGRGGAERALSKADRRENGSPRSGFGASQRATRAQMRRSRSGGAPWGAEPRRERGDTNQAPPPCLLEAQPGAAIAQNGGFVPRAARNRPAASYLTARNERRGGKRLYKTPVL